ncbi:hypothetical protein L1987_14759 [Smallanthus sonchifolius]|uniref:Uncharacterized protein n=1 Tax=Smallanthus sonchifolius TaxID=185202 RepID=A0ACB9J5Z6_9ASTR|nr:hypothetical protein L1987_14759 [Smallanthus sonchifolius]
MTEQEIIETLAREVAKAMRDVLPTIVDGVKGSVVATQHHEENVDYRLFDDNEHANETENEHDDGGEETESEYEDKNGEGHSTFERIAHVYARISDVYSNGSEMKWEGTQSESKKRDSRFRRKVSGRDVTQCKRCNRFHKGECWLGPLKCYICGKGHAPSYCLDRTTQVLHQGTRHDGDDNGQVWDE